MKKNIRIATACKDCDACPVVDYDPQTDLVTIHDPEEPKRGSFVLTKAEWDRIIETAEK